MRLNLEKEIAIYANFMGEIKARSYVVEFTLNGILLLQNRNSIQALAEAEKAILQIRYICELMTLSSLAVHSKDGLPKDLLKSYNPQDTFRRLEGINPECFPMPISLTRTPEGPISFAYREATLDAPGLEAIYGACGNLLHRGFLKHALQNRQRVYNLDVIFGWINQIADLLATHAILLPAHNVVLIVTLGDTDKPVHVAYAEADGDFARERPEKFAPRRRRPNAV